MIRYEDLISNFKGSVLNLLKFLDLSWSDQVSEFYKTSQKRGMITTPSYNQVNQPIYTKSIGRWKNYEKELEFIFPEIKFWIDRWKYKF